MGNTNFMPRQVTESNDSLDEGSNLFIRTLFLNTQAITYDIKCHDKSSNIDGYIELIDNEKRPVGKLTIQAKTYKSKYRGKKTAEIPSYFVAYAERMINEVCIFLSVDAVDKKIYWKYFTEEFIREFKKKGDCASHNYVFRQEEIISSGNVNSTINEWKHIFIEKVARFSQVTKDAQEIITENRVAFYSVNTYFHHLKDSFIERKEIGQLYDWVKKDLAHEESNLKLLVGNAGMGKSVVLKQVIHMLEEDGVKCFAIKADRFQFSPGQSCNEQLEGLVNTFSSLIHEEKAVLVIDQIDALSQYITKDRSKLENVMALIKVFTSNIDLRNVRIIVSCRSFDLEFDPKLSVLENESQIKLDVLSSAEVKRVVNKLQEDLFNNLDKKTITILQTPQYLNVFCKVFSGNKKKKKAFSSITDLYDELWRQSIDLADVDIDKGRAEVILYDLARKIYQEETVSPQWDFETTSFKEASYLISQGLIEHNRNCATFFHQSMYDYVFARLYTKEKRPFIQELLKEKKHQGLFVRSTVNLVLDYERAKNITQYKDDVNAILFSGKIRPHIQLMFLWSMANRKDILPFEKKCVKELYAKNKILFYAFIRRTWIKEWFIVIASIILDDIKNMKAFDSVYENVFGFLWNHVQINPEGVYNVVDSIKDEETKRIIVRKLLRGTSDYSLEIVTKWYKVICQSYIDKANFIDRAQNSNVKFVLSNLSEFIDHVLCPQNENNLGDDRAIERILDDICIQLKKDYSDDFYNILRERIINAINEHRISSWRGNIAFNNVFPLYLRHRSYSQTIHEWFAELLTERVTRCPESALEDVKVLLSQNEVSCYEFAFRAMMTNPLLFSDHILSILKNSELLDELLGYSDLSYYFLETLRKWFSLIDSESLRLCQNIIYDFKSKIDFEYDKDRSYKGLFFPHLGNHQRKLIWAIPDNLRDKRIKRRDHELNRRFGNKWNNNKPDHTITAASICGGLMSIDKYKFITCDNWLNSFVGVKDCAKGKFRYFDERVHADAFKQCVRERPEYFYSFVLKLFDINDVSSLYKLSGLSGLFIANYPLNQLLPLLCKCLDMYDEICKEGYCYKLFETIDLAIKIDGPHIDQIVEFLKDLILSKYHSKYDANIENEFDTNLVTNDMLNTGVNSIQGDAIQSLVKVGKISRMKSDVYRFFISSTEKLSIEHQLTAMYYLQKEVYDYDYYNEVMFGLSTKPISDYLFLNADRMHWFWCNSPETVLPYFKLIINNKRAQPILVQILFFGMEYGKVKDLSKEMFDSILSMNEIEVIKKIIPLAYNHLLDETYGDQSKALLRKFSFDKRQEIRNTLLLWCDHMHESDIHLFMEMLKNWVKDPFESGMHNIIKYLKKTFYSYPYECYQCIKILIDSKNVGIQYNEEEYFEILLKCYRTFMDNEDIEKADEVMDVFDILMLNSFTLKMGEILNEIDNN